MECKQEEIKKTCACTYTSCGLRGKCCDCLAKHLNNKELPACAFPPEAERTYDRSFEKFAEAWGLCD